MIAVTVQIANFAGPFAGLNAPPANYPVLIPELVMRAITVGGRVDGTRVERTLRRASIGALVRSAVREGDATIPAPALVATRLYTNIEPSEKGAITFRLGMGFAAILASRVLSVNKTLHLPGVGRRGDLYGRDTLGGWHVIEAKARTAPVPATVQAQAKAQAAALVPTVGGVPLLVRTDSASLADLSPQQQFTLLLDDPPPSDPGASRPVSVDEERFVPEYYSPVPDLVEITGPEPSGDTDIDEYAEGAWMPGGGIWLGLARGIPRRATRWQDVPDTRDSFASERDPSLVHIGDDGHVIVLDPRFEQ